MFFPAMYLRWQWSVPANLLLAGEYAITEEDGLGIALAVEPRASCSVYCTSKREPSPTGDSFFTAVRGLAIPLEADTLRSPTECGAETLSRLTIIARTSESEDRSWPGTASPLIESTVDVVRSYLKAESVAIDSHAESAHGADAARKWRIVIDTSPFFDDRTGRKLGLGSSAAAVCLLTGALMRIAGIDPVSRRDILIALAIEAHRKGHGGRGSGYDVVASAAGGAVRFRGGRVPSWERSNLQSQMERQRIALYGWSAGKAVQSAKAVERFQQYCPEGCTERERFIGENNRLIRRLEEARDWASLFRPLSLARRLGETIGEAIGVPATLPLSCAHLDDGWTVKASGAGNERAIILALPTPRRPLPPDADAMTPAIDGFRWEYGESTRIGRDDAAEAIEDRPLHAGRTVERGAITRRGMTIAAAADLRLSSRDTDSAAGLS
ncbi:MAG: hypothetical protein MI724_19730 [Spirochaetales bacterium]|nr:hypothetical protein [Spirochaetales bacterium]